MPLLLALAACRAPLPTTLDFSSEVAPVAPGIGVGRTTQLVPVPEGMVATGPGATVLLEGERARLLPFFGYWVRMPSTPPAGTIGATPACTFRAPR